MEFAECCDVYCTSCKIWYLNILRPGDSVPFKKPKYILPLGIAEIMIAKVIIVLDTLAIFCQSKQMIAPAPSLLGNPGFPLWISLLFIISGCCNVVAFKRKTRFTTAISFGASSISTIVVVTLLCVITMAIAEEITYYQSTERPTGVVISCIICILVLVLLAVTSSSTLLCYMALKSHDDRWFTDRGIQHGPPAPSADSAGCASLSVPSGEPAFLFYAPSTEAVKYTSTFRDVIKGLENKSTLRDDGIEDSVMTGVKTPDYSEEGTTVIEVDQDKSEPGNYLSSN